MIPKELTASEAADLHSTVASAAKATTGQDVLKWWGSFFDEGREYLGKYGYFNRSEMLAQALPEAIDNSETFFVTGDMVRLARMAAPDLEAMPLFAHDMPASQMFIIFDKVPGFVHYDKFVEEHDDKLAKVPIRAISVMQSMIGVKHKHDDADYKAVEDGVSIVTWVDAADLAKTYDLIAVKNVGGLVPIDMTGWAFNTRWKTADEDEQVDELPNVDDPYRLLPFHLGTQRQVVLSIFLLMNQELYSGRERVSRHVARRWERSRRVPEDFSVAVTRLRRIHSGNGEDDVPPMGVLSHRFLVRGHWRRLHKGTDDERAIWISPYIKGDPSLPFVPKQRITVLDR